jgi:hypothetical protein
VVDCAILWVAYDGRLCYTKDNEVNKKGNTMYDLTNVKVGDAVAHFYNTPAGQQVAIYLVVKETPKRFTIQRHNVKYQAAKKDGKVVGADFYVRPIGDKERDELEKIKEHNQVQRMRRELMQALEKNRLTDDQVKQMHKILVS